MSANSIELSVTELTLRLRQQELVAQFGLFALDGGPIEHLMHEACRVASEGLGTPLAKVLRFRPASNDLLVVAGVGWHAGVVGTRTLGSGLDSPAGYALHTGLPVLSNHLSVEDRFRMPGLLAEHGVQSAINVVVGQANQSPFGVLEVDSTRRHDFIQPDTAFLQAMANVLATALARCAVEAMKDALLNDKDMLMQEVHHRVSNSLQLVRTILGLQARGASNDVRQQLESAASRIMSIAAVHRRLYQGKSVLEGDAAGYLNALVEDMRGAIDDATGQRSVVLKAEPMTLPADDLTPLGLVVSELVTNALKYGAGVISVRVHPVDSGISVCVEDEGPGFGPEPSVAGRSGLGMRLVTVLAKGNPAHAVQIDRTVGHGRITVILKLR